MKLPVCIQMKNNNLVKFFLMAVLMTTLASAASADTPEPKTKVRSAAQKSISDYFKVPGFILPVHSLKKDTNEKVRVLFTTDSAGRVNFAIAQTGNVALRREVEKRFAGLVLKDLSENVVHGVTLSFVLQ